MKQVTRWGDPDKEIVTVRWGTIAYLKWCEKEAAGIPDGSVKRNGSQCAVWHDK